MDSTILVVGSINMDLAVRAPRIPLPGETILGSSLVESPGGKGANQAAAAGMLGGNVAMVGCVGRIPMAGPCAADCGRRAWRPTQSWYEATAAGWR